MLHYLQPGLLQICSIDMISGALLVCSMTSVKAENATHVVHCQVQTGQALTGSCRFTLESLRQNAEKHRVFLAPKLFFVLTLSFSFALR